MISNETLLEIARDVFLERGIGATTAEVAERAGVSEGTVFHRFKTKDALFRAAMNVNVDDFPEQVASLLDGADQGDIRETLIHIANGVIGSARVIVPLMMMSWSNPNTIEENFCPQKKMQMRAFFLRFVAFFEAQMNAGKLRRMDAEIFTRVFLGSLHQFVMSELTTENTDEFALPEGMFVRGLIDLLLVGAAAPNSIPRPNESVRRLSRL